MRQHGIKVCMLIAMEAMEGGNKLQRSEISIQQVKCSSTACFEP